jgi:signal transduction histidine kinase
MNRRPTIAFLLILLFSSQIQAQNQKIDSLHSLIKSQDNDTLLIKGYYELFNVFFPNNVDSSKKYLDKGLRQSRNTGYEKFYLQGLNFLSMFWLNIGQVDSALTSSDEALKLKDIGDNDLKYKALLNRGRALQTSSLFDESVEWYLKSLELAENLDDPSMIVSSLTNLGSVYWYLGDNKKAKEYYEKSLSICEEENDFLGQMASNLGNLGLIYRSEGNDEKALESYLKSNAIFQQLDEKLHVAINMQNIGVLYESREDWENAMKNFKESNRISSAIEDQIGIALTTINIAIIEAKSKNYKQSLFLFDSAISYSSSIKYKPAMTKAYEGLSETYREMGNYKKSLEARLNYEIWKDSLQNENYLNKISDLEAKYEFEKNQKEILALSEKNLVQEASIETKDFWIKILFIALFFLVIIGALFIILIRQRMRFRNKEMVFNAISNTELKEQHRIARDLHDSIGAMLAVIKNKLSGIDGKGVDVQTRSALKDSLGLISKTSDETRRIAHNMMPDDLMKFGLVSATESLLDSVKGENNVKMTCDHFGMERRLDQLKELNIFRIIQELIQNSLKHANPKNININFTRHEENLNIIMQDDGRGMPENYRENAGLGLSNIQTRLRLLNAKWQIDSHHNQGTSIVLDIPVKS